MILLVDVGNTRIKWLAWEQGQVAARGGLVHKGMDRATLGERLWPRLPPPPRVIVANVAGPDMAQALTAWIERTWSVRPQFAVTEAAAFGIRNAYARPQRLGVDRWVALIGARTLTTGACCVVDCGTAITVDALSAAGEHLGGMIFPGAWLMREALYRDTRQVTGEEGEVVLFGRDTQHCVWGGTAYAVAAAIDRISAEMAQAMGGQVQRLLTGGEAAALIPLLKDDYRLEPDLIFMGLLALAGER